MSEENRFEEARAGDAAAYEALLAPLLDPAYRLATVVLGDRAEAEDVVQEAALKAWTRLHQFRGQATFRAWFLGIVMNECRMLRRRPFWSALRLESPVVAQHTSAEDLAIARTDLARAVAGLDLEDRSALFVHFYLDLPLEESARLLGLSLGAAKSRIYRAARRLRPGVQPEEVLNR